MVVFSIPMGAAQVGLVSTDVLIEDAQADGDRARVLSFLGHDRLPSTKKPSLPDILLGRIWVPDDRFKTLTIRRCDMNENTLAHNTDTYKLNHHGIPKRTLPFRSIQ